MRSIRTMLAGAAALLSASAVASPRIPIGIVKALPPGYEVLASARISTGHPARTFEVVALGRVNEGARSKGGEAPPRPLVIFEVRGSRLLLVARNDHVVLKADEGGQCDPFLDGEATIAIKGRYFTVQNGVACGQHWTDYITFRLDDRAGFVFDNQRTESWTLNPSNDPNAEALVRDGPPHVRRDRPAHVTPFASWRPAR